MPTHLVRLSTEAGGLYVRPEHVLAIAPGIDQVDERGVRQRSVIQVWLPDVVLAGAARVQGWDSIGWIVFGSPDDVAAALSRAGARK